MGWCGDGVWGSFDGHRDWLQKRPVSHPATGRVQGLWGRLRAPLTVPEWGAVCAFGKDHVTRASNFDTGEQDAAEVVHQLAPSGSTSLFLDTLAGFTASLGSVLARALAGSVETGVGLCATHDAVGPDLLARRPMRSAHCDAAG
jgi:hypothetical protein